MKTNESNTYPIKIIESLIHIDPGLRGINFLPQKNLCTQTQNGLLDSSKKIVKKPGSTIGIVTGFYIPYRNPPAPETDGPLGALALARGLNLLGYTVLLISDNLCVQPLSTGKEFFAQQMKGVEIIEFPFESDDLNSHERQVNDPQFSVKSLEFVNGFFRKHPSLKFLISIERVGPCHTLNSVLKQNQHISTSIIADFKKHGPDKLANHCLNMKGESITAYSAKIHLLFEYIYQKNLPITTIGIGDSGNEIGMGSIPWEVIHKNIISGLGGKIACRIPTNYTIVAGVSNWAGYALMAAIYLLLAKQSMFLDNFLEESETKLMQQYFDKKLAIDGVLGYPNMSVDGVDWEIHLSIIRIIRNIINV